MKHLDIGALWLLFEIVQPDEQCTAMPAVFVVPSAKETIFLNQTTAWLSLSPLLSPVGLSYPSKRTGSMKMPSSFNIIPYAQILYIMWCSLVSVRAVTWETWEMSCTMGNNIQYSLDLLVIQWLHILLTVLHLHLPMSIDCSAND